MVTGYTYICIFINKHKDNMVLFKRHGKMVHHLMLFSWGEGKLQYKSDGMLMGNVQKDPLRVTVGSTCLYFYPQKDIHCKIYVKTSFNFCSPKHDKRILTVI